MYQKIGPIDLPDDDTGFNKLAWSKASESRFRVLSIMACDLLTVPLSAIALEHAFSAMDDLLAKERRKERWKNACIYEIGA